MFKFLIEGKTIKELKANIDEFFKEFEALQPSVKVKPSQDITAHFAAKLPDVPKVEAEPARSIQSSVESAVPIPAIPKAIVNAAGTTTTNDYGLDQRGLPWDERIHSVSQGKNKDGSWRYKRGVEENAVKTVEAELASKMQGVQAAQMEVPSIPAQPLAAPTIPSAMGPTPALPGPSAPVYPVAPPSMNHLNIVPTPAVVVAPPPMPPPQPAVPSAHTFATFKATLVPTLAKLVKEGKLDQTYLKSLCDHYGVEMLFKVNDEQLAEVFEGFVQYGLIVKA